MPEGDEPKDAAVPSPTPAAGPPVPPAPVDPTPETPAGDLKKSAENPPPPNQNDLLILARSRTWDEPTFKAGLVVGLLLVACGLALQMYPLVAHNIALLVLCSGLGLVLGAFGSLAVLNLKGLTVAGVAALVIALIFVVDSLGPGLVRIRLDGDLRQAVEVSLIGNDPFPAARSKEYIDFFIVAKSLGVERLKLSIPFPDPAGGEGREVIFPCIPPQAVEPYIGRGIMLSWRFDRANETLTGIKGVEGETLHSGNCERKASRLEIPDIVSAAWAQDLGIPQLLDDLESDVISVRRSARDSLSQIGKPAIRPMMERWKSRPSSYRVRLGVSVALTQFLRDNKDSRKEVSKLLTDFDYRLLTTAIDDPDRTLRVYATEFLFDLGDTRILIAAQGSFAGASDDGKYNFIVAIEGAIPDLNDEQKARLKAQLASWSEIVGSKTRREIEKAASKL